MNKEPITLHLETFNNEEYILADECIEAIGLHRRTNTELHQTIEERDKEIERLNNIIKEAINYIDDNTYYKDHKGHINIDDLYIILKGVDKE